VPFSTEDRIALVGAGAMGAPIVRHLVKAGFPVTVCDPNADRRAGAEAVGACSTSTVDDLGDCRVALVMVPTDDDVRLVAERYGAVAPAGAALVINSSVQTATCLAVAEALRPRRIRVVDAALTGGVRGAEAGRVDLLVGGSDADVADLTPVFAPWASRINHLGPLGTGQVGKTVANLIHWGEIVLLAEALSLGAELGVPVSVMRRVLESGPADSRTLRELQEMRFTWYEKDIDVAVRMAATVGRELVLSTFVQRLMRDIDVPKMAALLADRGTVELTGTLEAAPAPTVHARTAPPGRPQPRRSSPPSGRPTRSRSSASEIP
jgi:3-hydroxyisobutyrate dehydrogenase-like beta-hydroxyacid dehydrogenase